MTEPLPEWELEFLGLPPRDVPDSADELLARAVIEDIATWGLQETVNIWGWRLVNQAGLRP